MTRDRFEHVFARFLPDGQRIVFVAGETGKGRRLYVQAVSGGTPLPISTEGVVGLGPVSPDGRFVAAASSDFSPILCPTTPGDPRPIPGSRAGEWVIQWSPDSKSVYLSAGQLPAKVFRVDAVTGKRELWKEFAPSDPSGVVEIPGIVMTPDASAYAYTFVRLLSDLYVAEGLN